MACSKGHSNGPPRAKGPPRAAAARDGTHCEELGTLNLRGSLQAVAQAIIYKPEQLSCLSQGRF